MLIQPSCVRGAAYRELISFLSERCDTLGFTLSEPGKTKIIDSEYQVRFSDLQTEYEQYLVKIEPVMEILKKHVLLETEDFFTEGTISGHVFHNYRVKLNSEVTDLLLTKECLTDWDYPNAPSDLCFYRNGMCYLSCIAHEDTVFIETEDKVEQKFFKKISKEKRWKHGIRNK